MLILISEVGEKLIMNELELIYWYSVILAYLNKLKIYEKDNFLNFELKDEKQN